MYRSALLFYILLLPALCFGQQYALQYVDTKTDASFRALSVAGDSAVWVSGSKGWVGRSVNNGKDWTFNQVPGHETLDFRTLYAFDADNAIIANAGSPAYILRTTDGGASWQQVYENTDSAAFIDGTGFWNKKDGMIYGDPINGRMLLLYTKDGGKTWKEQRNSPEVAEGQASFAASGTNISCFLHGAVVIAAGGKKSTLFFSRNRGRRWRGIPTPMLATSESTGIFSFMLGGSRWQWLIAGGDYKLDSLRTDNFFYSTDKGKKWLAPETTTRGYRECLSMLYDAKTSKKEKIRAMFAVGPSGIDISTDYGVNWKPLFDEKGFHVIKKSREYNSLFVAGGNGQLAIMRKVE